MQLQDGCFFSNFVSILFCNSIRIAHNLGNLAQRKLEDCFDQEKTRNHPNVLLIFNISINKIIEDLNKYVLNKR